MFQRIARLELATSSLEGQRSTTELNPHTFVSFFYNLSNSVESKIFKLITLFFVSLFTSYTSYKSFQKYKYKSLICTCKRRCAQNKNKAKRTSTNLLTNLCPQGQVLLARPRFVLVRRFNAFSLWRKQSTCMKNLCCKHKSKICIGFVHLP